MTDLRSKIEKYKHLETFAEKHDLLEDAMGCLVSAIFVVERDILATPAASYDDVNAKLDFTSFWLTANKDSCRLGVAQWLRDFADEIEKIRSAEWAAVRKAA